MNRTKLVSLTFSLSLIAGMISLTSCGKKVKEIIVRQVDPHYQEELENVKQELEKIRNIKAQPGPQGERGADGRDGVDGKDGEKGEKGDKGDKGDAGRDGVNGIDCSGDRKMPPRPMPTPSWRGKPEK